MPMMRRGGVCLSDNRCVCRRPSCHILGGECIRGVSVLSFVIMRVCLDGCSEYPALLAMLWAAWV